MRRILLVMLSAGTLILAGWSIDAGAVKASIAASTVTVLPVVSCPTSYGAGGRAGVFVPKSLPADTSQRGLSFYSNGLNTVLAPAGWRCGALVAADGGQVLSVYPPGKPDYSTRIAPKGAQLVQVDVDYTGHLPGGELVCGLFPHSAAAAAVRGSGGLACAGGSSRERIDDLTKDITTFVDPAGVTGVGAGSGGSLQSVGAGVYPQVIPAPQSVDVALLSCTLPRRGATLCHAIEGDFLVRYTPVDEGTTTDG
jgi:hypothetical protein